MTPPAHSRLTAALGLDFPLIGFYDVPDTAPFAPLVKPGGCLFEHARDWRLGYSVALSPKHIGCRGSGYWLCGVQSRSTDQLVTFLHEEEGLKDSAETTRDWLSEQTPYTLENGFIVVGPLRKEQEEYLRTVTFLVSPDQLAMLITGAEYRNAGASVLTRAPFGSGCMQLAPPLEGQDAFVAWISLTDVAMRRYVPDGILGFTVTRPVYEQLCTLGDDSFLEKRFWNDLREARKQDQR
jgi:hypothetical protein